MNINPIRIKTMCKNEYKVYTLYHDGKWITIATSAWNMTKSQSYETTNLFEAGENHLRLAKQYAKT